MKKILIINGHPNKESFCNAIANKYMFGAKQSGADCKLINLVDLKFSPILKYGYSKETPLEKDLINTWEDIKEAEHIVFVYPIWWSTQPALVKGFIDRLFLPGLAFSYKKNSKLWNKLLKGKSARVIVTMDTPIWYYRFINKRPNYNAMKTGVLGFCGIKPVKFTSFSPIRVSTLKRREKWLKKVESIGRKMN